MLNFRSKHWHHCLLCIQNVFFFFFQSELYIKYLVQLFYLYENIIFLSSIFLHSHNLPLCQSWSSNNACWSLSLSFVIQRLLLVFFLFFFFNLFIFVTVKYWQGGPFTAAFSVRLQVHVFVTHLSLSESARNKWVVPPSDRHTDTDTKTDRHMHACTRTHAHTHTHTHTHSCMLACARTHPLSF